MKHIAAVLVFLSLVSWFVLSVFSGLVHLSWFLLILLCLCSFSCYLSSLLPVSFFLFHAVCVCFFTVPLLLDGLLSFDREALKHSQHFDNHHTDEPSPPLNQAPLPTIKARVNSVEGNYAFKMWGEVIEKEVMKFPITAIGLLDLAENDECHFSVKVRSESESESLIVCDVDFVDCSC